VPDPSKPFIVHFIRHATGGMKNHLIDLVRGLSEKGYRLAVVSPPNDSLRSAMEALNIPFHQLPMRPGLSPTDLAAIWRLAGLLRVLGPDLFHIHGNKSALLGRPAAFLARVPAMVLTVHNFLVYQNARLPARTLAVLTQRRLFSGIDRIIAVSDSLKKNMVENQGLAASKIEVIHNGVDYERWQEKPPSPRSQLGLSESDFVVVAVGRLVDWKGHDVLINAAAELRSSRPDIRIAIAGEGPMRPRLERLIRAGGLEQSVSLLGHVADVRALLAAADLFVLPSLNEPFGIVLLEAMAAGLPVIATNAGGVPEIITDDQNGVLLPPAEAAVLSREISALAADAPRRRRLGDCARITVKERFALEDIIERTEEVYKTCLRTA
jgi:glycosyltransferase involved in cell wall biosynthesis